MSNDELDALAREALNDIQQFPWLYESDHLRIIRAALARASEPQWQPIETAPTKTEVLIWKPESESAVVALLKDGRWVTAWAHDPCSDDDFPATHWMPLPSAPKEQP